MKNNLLLSFPIAAACLLPAQHGQAQDNMLRIVNPDPKGVAVYWTPELLKAATPFPMPHPAQGATASQATAPARAGNARSGDAHAPALQVRLPVRRLFTPDAVQERAVVTPHAGIYSTTYTSTRVFPMFDGAAAPYSADRAYPYITVGKLFFTAGGKPMFCSASVIQRRIVVTAGHCVHSGTSSGFFSNWMFVPAFRDGTAPLLTWNWRAAIVTGTWAAGGGIVPNAADYAMIAFDDQPVGRSVRALGNVTGWLGWRTLTLEYNHTSKLGYPCNLDNCQKMQDITGNAHGGSASNNVVVGSDAKEGSDGGPWVQNFQVLQAGGGTGYFAGPNQVVGVTSFSETVNGTQAQGSSIPDGRWVNIFNVLCGLAPGNCE
jgi:V8-like Glu-specific endopeptidase